MRVCIYTFKLSPCGKCIDHQADFPSNVSSNTGAVYLYFSALTWPMKLKSITVRWKSALFAEPR